VIGLTDEIRTYLHTITGFEPLDEALWIEALTHGSTGERRTYERLEFLGDRVLGLAVAEWLSFDNEEREGVLSQRLNALVSGVSCAEVAREIGLGARVRLGKQARDDGGEDSDNILGDVIEALIGACFRERGFEGARAMVRHLWADRIIDNSSRAKHPKSALQEWAAGNRRKLPQYRLVDRAGPDHAARFTVEVSIKGIGEVEATGSSKQDAETLAAAEFMRRFG
jgi:ribonuclease-3